MLRAPSISLLLAAHLLKVRFLFYHSPVFLLSKRFSSSLSSSSPTQSSPCSSSENEISKTHINLSSINASDFVKSVISRCSHLWTKKGQPFPQSNLKHHLLKIYHISPATARRFLRVSDLKPEDVLEILLGFEFGCGKPAVEARKVGALWELFKWASDQTRDFKHLPRSCEIMATLLIRVGLIREVECLLSIAESRGVLMDNHEVFDNLLRGYVSMFELENAILVYDRMKASGIVPSWLCYHALLDLLINTNETQLALRVYLDMVGEGLKLTDAEIITFENVIKLLCQDRNIQQARNVVKMVIPLGLKPSNRVLNDIASGYCRRNDFEDLLSFYAEINCPPDTLAGNKIIYHSCRLFGIETADMFMQDLVHLGFCPDAITFGILVGLSCCEGKLKTALFYLSESLSCNLKPAAFSYNAILSGLFKRGMWKHAQDIVDEMVDGGVMPNMLTYRILLAGYCKARRFDEAKLVIGQMVNHGLIPSSSMDDPLSCAFLVLGLNPLAIRVKRDNEMGLFKTEFFDSLGNGLYLDTNQGEYEMILSRVLEDSMIVDFNLHILHECGNGNMETALSMVDIMIRWGQELSVPAFSVLVKHLCRSNSYLKTVTNLSEKFPDLLYELDEETFNLVVQAYSKTGFTCKGRKLLKSMLQKHLKIKNETYSALMMGFCKNADSRGLVDCLELAQKDKWLPGVKDFSAVVGFFCRKDMLKEALELFDALVVSFPDLASDIFAAFLQKLSVTGNTAVARVLVELPLGSTLGHTVYNILIRGFCIENKISDAVMIYDNILAKKLTLCLDACVLLVCQLCRHHRFEKIAVLKESCSRMHPLASFSVHGALIHGFCKAGRVEEAAEILQNMLSKGLHPDGGVCNVLTQGHCQVNNLRKVSELLGVMIRKDMDISLSSYRKLVQLMCKEGKFCHALSLKEFMPKESWSHCLVLYNILIFYLLTNGKGLIVNAVLNELQEKGLLPNEVTYNFLVYGFFRCKDMSSSMKHMTNMMFKGLTPSSRSLGTAISGLINGGDLEGAMELSRAMELKGCIHGSAVQHTIVNCLLSHGKIHEAEKFLDRIAEKDLIPRRVNYDILINSFCQFGRLSKAVDLLNIMLKKGNIPAPSSYNYLIQGFCLHNKLDKAADFHFEMLAWNLKPSINTCNIYVNKLCQIGRTAEAEDLLTSMVRIGETPSREMYNSVINRYRFEEKFSKASELLQAMQQNGYAPDFETHWSLIGNLRDSRDKEADSSKHGFLSSLLSGSGLFQGKLMNKTIPGGFSGKCPQRKQVMSAENAREDLGETLHSGANLPQVTKTLSLFLCRTIHVP